MRDIIRKQPIIKRATLRREAAIIMVMNKIPSILILIIIDFR